MGRGRIDQAGHAIEVRCRAQRRGRFRANYSSVGGTNALCGGRGLCRKAQKIADQRLLRVAGPEIATIPAVTAPVSKRRFAAVIRFNPPSVPQPVTNRVIPRAARCWAKIGFGRNILATIS